jgi:predicted enzyme related to lactoylglutathione lyase
MAATKPTFAWYELMTTDTAAAAAFYSSVIGWTPKDVGMPGMPYTTFNVGEVGIAGMLVLPEEASAMGQPPSWIGYIHVDNCDAYAEKVVEAGGKILKPATDVPGMLRFVVVSDPQGAAFVLFTSNPAMASPPNRPTPPTPGTVGWHELYTTDLEAGFSFYSNLLGWEKASDMDMGPMGIYRIYSDGDPAKAMGAGGMMNKDPNIPSPYWGFYFQVDAVGAAIERVKAGGGNIINGPMQVPGNSWIAQGIDPQGAMFSIVSFVK